MEIPAERLEGWLERFGERNGALSWDAEPGRVTVWAANGATAVCAVPFPPLEVRPQAEYGGLLEHVLRERRIGVLLVRKGGYAAGVFLGSVLVSSKVGSRLVQGRSAAGGSSQQRFARRRENQAKQAYAAAADTAARVLLPAIAHLEAVVLGGDRRALDATLDDSRLAALRPLLVERILSVVEPRLRVLQATPAQFRGLHLDIIDPPAP
ncbi:MAG: hypothetical protein H0V67_01640 [Geodermatophilaceae bacterium]|nr:hypothetical protein [Geodermatophilaceae bacterium]